MRRFWKDESGNTAMIFGASLFGVLCAIGLAVDYAQIRSEQTVLQGQVDAAVLALAKSGAETDTERENIVMGSLLDNGYVVGSYIPQFDITDDGAVRVWASTDYNPMLMGLFGKSEVKINAESESRIAKDMTVEIVMVLDTTESMSGAKMTALKQASTGLVNAIAVFDDAEVKIGLVPFSNYVNVSTAPAIRNAGWITVPPDTSRTENYMYQPQRQTASGTPQSCTGSETYWHTSYDDGVERRERRTRSTGCSGGSGATYVNDGPPQNRTRTITETWHGCVGSRNRPLNVRDGGYGNRVPGLMNVNCASPLVPLTTNYGDMRNKISALTTSGDTYMPAGIAWGQRVLSSRRPYLEGVGITGSERKIMILMTDGVNTLYLSGDRHVSTDPTKTNHDVNIDGTNDDTKKACRKAKADGTEIYSIAFEVADQPTRRMLKACASTPDHYFDANNSAELITVFRNIAAQIINVRLTQ